MHARGLQPVAQPVSAAFVYFNSCMREDCNYNFWSSKVFFLISIHACVRIVIEWIFGAAGWCRISIHACARIATSKNWCQSAKLSYFDSCMREDCNQVRRDENQQLIYFNSCMCEDCNGIFSYTRWIALRFRFMHARRLQPGQGGFRPPPKGF